MDMFTNDNISDENKESLTNLIGGIYKQCKFIISQNLNLGVKSMDNIIDNAPYTAQEAKKLNLIDDTINYKLV